MITQMVKECIEQHGGGEKFFDALDEKIRGNGDIFYELYSTVENLAWESKQHIYNIMFISSGKFGNIFKEYINNVGFNIVNIEGGLRSNEIQNPEQYQEQIQGKYCIFVDDTYFAGRTYGKIKDMVNTLGGCMLGCAVAYDGSKSYEPHVYSLYRYYDNFGQEAINA